MTKNHRLNTISAGTEAIFHMIIGLFSICCIIPFLFVIIISLSAESSIREIGYAFIPKAWSFDTYTYAIKRLRISSLVQSTRSRVWSHFSRISLISMGSLLCR